MSPVTDVSPPRCYPRPVRWPSLGAVRLLSLLCDVSVIPFHRHLRAQPIAATIHACRAPLRCPKPRCKSFLRFAKPRRGLLTRGDGGPLSRWPAPRLHRYATTPVSACDQLRFSVLPVNRPQNPLLSGFRRGCTHAPSSMGFVDVSRPHTLSPARCTSTQPGNKAPVARKPIANDQEEVTRTRHAPQPARPETAAVPRRHALP